MMTNEELNTELYRKLFDEQERYREVLLSLPPEQILNHAYEYTIREDILLSFEYRDLSNEQAMALLKGEYPLRDIFEKWEDRETGHMEDIWSTVEIHANEAIHDETQKADREARKVICVWVTKEQIASAKQIDLEEAALIRKEPPSVRT